MPVNTTYSDLDDAIDTLRRITEKYTRLLYTKKLQELEPLHQLPDAMAMYSYVCQLLEHIDLPEEMKHRKLQNRWDEIFLEPWASPEGMERVRVLAEMPPPRRVASGN